MKIENIKTVEQMIALMARPPAIIKNAENGKTIGRIFRQHGYTTVKLYARWLDQSFVCTAHAVEFVEAKIGKAVEVV